MNVLLVEPDERQRDRIGGWLEAAGHEVLSCPGPRAPAHVCVGGLGRRCALAMGADVVVLDLQLDSDTEMVGTSALDLAAYYRQAGLPVIAFGTERPQSSSYLKEIATRIGWPVRPEPLVAAVHATERSGTLP